MDQADAGGNIGNYKGVMLCNRPNEVVATQADREFITTHFYPKDKIGLNPIMKKYPFRQVQPNVILIKHKAWLKQYEKHVQNEIANKEEEVIKKLEKKERIKQIAKRDRDNTKVFQQELDVVKNFLAEDKKKEEPEEQKDKLKSSLKQSGGQKPKWAMTQEEVDEQDQQDENELMDFASNLDFEDYLQDFEVKTMLQALKHRVKEIKDEEQGNENPQETDNVKVEVSQVDKYETRSQKSNASNQTRQSVRELREKMAKEQLENREDWDSSVKGDPHLEYEHRLANKIADEILKRSKALKRAT